MASKGVNKVILLGNVGRDPDIRTFPDGGQIVTLSLATSESWKGRDTGELQERTEWHRVVFKGKLAEIVGQYVVKGSKLYVEGKLQTRKWQDQSGADRYSTEIVVDGFGGSMQMLDSKPSGQRDHHHADTPSQAERHAPESFQAPSGGGSHAGHDGFDDDIPFRAMCSALF